MSAGLSLRRMRWRCHWRVGVLLDVAASEGEDSEVNREERKRGEIGDFIVVVVVIDSAEDILWRSFFFAQSWLDDMEIFSQDRIFIIEKYDRFSCYSGCSDVERRLKTRGSSGEV